MSSILPRISMSDLQRYGKERLAAVQDYAVIQRHGKDVAFILHPELGRMLLESGMLDILKKKRALPYAEKSEQTLKEKQADSTGDSGSKTLKELDNIIGQVLRELSKR